MALRAHERLSHLVSSATSIIKKTTTAVIIDKFIKSNAEWAQHGLVFKLRWSQSENTKSENAWLEKRSQQPSEKVAEPNGEDEGKRNAEMRLGNRMIERMKVKMEES